MIDNFAENIKILKTEIKENALTVFFDTTNMKTDTQKSVRITTVSNNGKLGFSYAHITQQDQNYLHLELNNDTPIDQLRVVWQTVASRPQNSFYPKFKTMGISTLIFSNKSNLPPSFFQTRQYLERQDEKIKKELSDYFEKTLSNKIPPARLSFYDKSFDGPSINPSLKILGGSGNSIENGRWEIFVLLIDESGKIGIRSGVKSETMGISDLGITNQYDNRLFANHQDSLSTQKLLTSYRWGHPSLALNINSYTKGSYELLPVFSGGWLLRNDDRSQKKIQIFWNSGRYSTNVSHENRRLLEQCVSFNLISEYGKDFVIEAFSFDDTNIKDFLARKSTDGRTYSYDRVSKELTNVISFQK